MFEVSVKGSFSAAHTLREIGGKCENLHGHNFTVEVHVRAERLTAEGVVIDFRELKSLLNGILEGLDHRYLNEAAPFIENNPSSENLARYIHHKIKEKIGQGPTGMRVRVDVWESDTSRASYWEP